MSKTHHAIRRARHDKTMLLPMPKRTADELALRVHLSLAALRRGAAVPGDAQSVLQALVFLGFLTESGYAALAPARQAEADRILDAAFCAGRESGEWKLSEPDADALAIVAADYDRALQGAPLWAIAEASERLDRLQAGKSCAPSRKLS